MKRLRFELNPGLLQPLSDRFVASGYKDPLSPEKAMETICTNALVEGVGFWAPGGELTVDNASAIRARTESYGKKMGTIVFDTWTRREYKWGCFTSKDPAIRAQTLEYLCRAKDIAEAAGIETIGIWLAHDGVDYPFQLDFVKAYDWLVEGIGKAAAYKPHIRLAIEPKIREPRMQQLICNTGDALNLIDEIGDSSVGMCLDAGHAIIAGERLGNAAARCLRKGKLFSMHFGDNYRLWDDDVIVGSVNTIEFLELVYWLRKYDWDGWCGLDQYPFKNNALDACEESILWIRGMEDMVERIGISTFGSLMENDEPKKAMALIRQAFFDMKD